MITLNNSGIYGPYRHCIDPKLRQLGRAVAEMLAKEGLTVSQVEEVLGEVESIVYHNVPLRAPRNTQPRPEETPDEADA